MTKGQFATYDTVCNGCGKTMTFKDGQCAPGSCVECLEPLRLRFWDLFDETRDEDDVRTTRNRIELRDRQQVRNPGAGAPGVARAKWFGVRVEPLE